MTKSLNDFVKENMKFLKLEDGQSYTGVYGGFGVIPNKFDPGKETVEYKFKDSAESESEITWTNGTIKVAQKFAKVKEGSTFTLTRTGVGPKTDYQVTNDETVSF